MHKTRFWHIARQTLQRVLYLIPILLVASFGIFMLLRLSVGDPIAQYLTLSNLPTTQENIAFLEAEFGLDTPLISQYIAWLYKAITLDFGTSFMSGEPVSAVFFSRLPITLTLVGIGVVLIGVFASIFGSISALYKERFPDIVISIVCFIGACMPSFWLAFLLVWVFAITLGWLPAVWDSTLSSFVLPSISLVFMSLCVTTRLLRTSMLEVLDSRFVLYAKIRQLPRAVITYKHIFKNAILPLLAIMGLHIGELLGGALIIESIFGIPGIGLYCIQGIANHDYPIIQCFVIVLCVVFTLANVLVDVLCAYLDPRISL
ncbi:ABC transporter permease subunit [Helicobacter zhangjianzhongii]|uniref:ABC transporter permease subunit n=1 Tax=Helicobacter zhangjianzhongii TaxID=2974574 RepID=A0ACC6FPS2_9HELI|nr:MULTISPECIES: ABC transporter permease subunit [unclassified Helicobacter]MDL0079196.1 ABC transporter permease subunit [Helicobacter sp. CPD2-1]MDL0081223.1 ABC transporter permease subunit [Helicobacter sp. XJK30-2]